MSRIDEIPAELVDNVRRHDIDLNQSIENDASTVVNFISGLFKRNLYWVPFNQHSVSFIRDIVGFMAGTNRWTMEYRRLVVERITHILNR